jgi:hypothetical protein
MKITTKFNLKSKVFALVDNEIVALEVFEIIPGRVNEVRTFETKYGFLGFGANQLELTENKLFATKQELVNSLL